MQNDYYNVIMELMNHAGVELILLYIIRIKSSYYAHYTKVLTIKKNFLLTLYTIIISNLLSK